MGSVTDHLWASAPFDLGCSVFLSEREMKVLIISYKS